MPLLNRDAAVAFPVRGGNRFHLAQSAPRPPRYGFLNHPGYGGKGEALAAANRASGCLCTAEAIKRQQDGLYVPVVWLRGDQGWLEIWVSERGAVTVPAGKALGEV